MQTERETGRAMKTERPAAPKKTAGTLQAEKLCARCNKLTEAERRKLRDEAKRQHYGTEPKLASARRKTFHVYSKVNATRKGAGKFMAETKSRLVIFASGRGFS